jgi:1-acyl-sn-glycerol-3-phosphate acyltransferase
VPGQPLRLQRGAANIAVRGRLDITPVRITCTPATLTKGQKWYRVPSRRFHVQLQIGEDIPIAPFLAEDDSPRGDALAARRVTDHLTRYFDLSGDPTRAST